MERALGAGCAPLERVLARRTVTIERVRDAARALVDHRHLGAAWSSRPWDRAVALGQAMDVVRRVADASARPLSVKDPLYTSLAPARALAERSLVAGEDSDAMEAELVALRGAAVLRSGKQGRGRYGAGVEREELVRLRAELLTALERFTVEANADLAWRLRAELQEVVRLYEVLKTERGLLDFDDLLLVTRALLVRDPVVRDAFSARFTYLLVDEFQDTDPSQAEILLLLASADPVLSDPLSSPPAPGKLFLVGDPKQSIYRFRHADIATYERVKEIIVTSGGAVLHLSRSYRAVPEIQGFVNAVFAPLLSGDARTLQAEYVPLEPVRPSADGPRVIALPVPRPYGKRQLALSAIEASYPVAVAAFIEWLISESGLTVDRPGGRRSPVTAADVCILFRQLGGAGERIARGVGEALTARNIAHAVLGGRAAGERDEIRGVTTALGAIERPDDALTVYAALRGFLFGLSDDALFEFKERYGSLDPLRRPREDLPASLEPVGLALELLAELHEQRNRRPVAETVAALVSATRGHVTLALSPAGGQALAHLAALAHRASSFERREGLSFRAFVDGLDDDAGSFRPFVDGDPGDTGGVRMMTVHKAKGLEFSVVILGDPTSKPWRTVDKVVDVKKGLAALRLCDLAPWDLVEAEELEAARVEAEGVRIAYVAATRARDLLVVPFVGDDVGFPHDGWAACVAEALAPERPRTPISKRPWQAGFDSVLNRKPEGEPPLVDTVAPGDHPTRGGIVSFFDPVRLDVPIARSGISNVEVLGEGAAPQQAEADAARLEAIMAGRRADTLAARAPGRVVTTVTAHARAAPAPGGAVEVERVPREAGRPHGTRFGTLVHQVLATTPLDAAPPAIEGLARAVATLLGAPDEEAAFAARAVVGALAHPVLEAARRAGARGGLRREVPVVVPNGDGHVLDGVVDLALLDEGSWLVVDYKTEDPDAMPPERLDVYRAQVRIYAAGVAAATGLPSRAALLFV
jgi:ATP-dependent exoDNAse (exonuclease V) beta subunit